MMLVIITGYHEASQFSASFYRRCYNVFDLSLQYGWINDDGDDGAGDGCNKNHT